MRSFLCFVLAGLVLIVYGHGHAMSIGEIEVESSLGEPLNARVAVQLDEGPLPQKECFRLAGPARLQPGLANATLSLVTKGEKRYVSITTPAPVYEPILDITLRSEDCGPAMQRDFVVLLSPPDLMFRQQAPLVTATGPASAGTDRRKGRRDMAKPVRQAGMRAIRVDKPSSGQTRSAGAGKPFRYVFRLDFDHTAFGAVAERVAKERQLAHASGRPIGAPAMADERDRLVLQSLPAQAGVAPGSLPEGTLRGGQATTPAGSAVPGATVTSSITSSGESGGEAKGGAAAGSAAKREAAAAKPARGWFLPNNLLFLLLLLLFAVAVALWLKFRAPSSRFMDRTQTVLDKLHPADPDDPQRHPLLSRNLPPIDEVFKDRSMPPQASPAAEVAQADGRPAEGEAEPRPQSEPPDADLAMDFHATDEVSVDTADSPESVLELAEVMLAFGRAGQAVEALDYYIRNHPRHGVEPWLKLLDLYFQSGQRAEFEALSGNLHNYFNVAIPDWAAFERERSGMEPAELSLESLHHIMARLTSLWGKPECAAYLDSLLADNRGGHRLGFALPIVRDILMLRDILRHGDLTVSQILPD